ncbi:hypothetical protein, partial [Nostoc linckia]|uniref:hypothetical protein n=1 Tax=Nostoc linckia TaxID=92942 RepID=UPI001C55828E
KSTQAWFDCSVFVKCPRKPMKRIVEPRTWTRPPFGFSPHEAHRRAADVDQAAVRVFAEYDYGALGKQGVGD